MLTLDKGYSASSLVDASHSDRALGWPWSPRLITTLFSDQSHDPLIDLGFGPDDRSATQDSRGWKGPCLDQAVQRRSAERAALQHLALTQTLHVFFPSG